MDTPSLTREPILTALIAALKPREAVFALWEAGAAAFGRVDEWSDIDLSVAVAESAVDETFKVIEETLAALSPIDLKYEVPQPTWHGHAQVFYRLTRAGKFLLLDITLMKVNSTNKFLEPEIHGHPLIHFDKAGVVQAPAADPVALADRLKERLASLRITFDLFQTLTEKELNRDNDIEALAFYHGFTLRPLVEVLRIRYQPARHNFYTRYIHYDLPEEAVQKLCELFFVRDALELRAKRRLAEDWFYATLEAIE
jgi:hypothetical protein